ncbi:hypothetical protein DE146DRAFT_658115 [Phaeosphaeria sp. MPI-PUGE-AT-0046c]|nr:hypothetical protein DE146DRAFT_658115 [Phaeosphaeria sp. MPI-PUGE-AT-0046c]
MPALLVLLRYLAIAWRSSFSACRDRCHLFRMPLIVTHRLSNVNMSLSRFCTSKTTVLTPFLCSIIDRVDSTGRDPLISQVVTSQTEFF